MSSCLQEVLRRSEKTGVGTVRSAQSKESTEQEYGHQVHPATLALPRGKKRDSLSAPSPVQLTSTARRPTLPQSRLKESQDVFHGQAFLKWSGLVRSGRF